MRMSWLTVCVLIVGVVTSGCSATGKTPDPADSAQGDGIHEYRAVCTQKNLHAGNEIVLSTWREDRRIAKDYGDYHTNHKGKGHIVKIEQRVKGKAAEAKPSAAPQ
jgi:hypothetical protein